MLITFLIEPNLILLHTVKLFQVLVFITNSSIKHQSLVYTRLHYQTVLFQTIQCQMVLFDWTLSGAAIPGLSGLGSDSNEWVLHIPQSLIITGASPSDCLLSYPGQSLRVGLTPVQRCSRCIPPLWPTGLTDLDR